MISSVLIASMIKTGAITLVTVKVIRAMGDKDNADIIKAAGICLVGKDFILFTIPIIEWFNKVGTSLSKIADKIEHLGGWLSRFGGV